MNLKTDVRFFGSTFFPLTSSTSSPDAECGDAEGSTAAGGMATSIDRESPADFVATSTENMWTVPLLEVQAIHFPVLSNVIQFMSALSLPRRSSCKSRPSSVENMRSKVPFFEAVAHNFPSAVNAIATKGESWAFFSMVVFVV